MRVAAGTGGTQLCTARTGQPLFAEANDILAGSAEADHELERIAAEEAYGSGTRGEEAHRGICE